MTQRFGFSLAAVMAIALCAATADTASAWHRNRDWGSAGGNGSNGSWGGGWGSNGSNGSWGGLFARRRGSWGSHGSNGGNGSCGSHGGRYGNGKHEEVTTEGGDHQASTTPRREVRYYGPRQYSGGEAREPAPAAPVLNEGAQQPALNAPQNQGLSAPRQ